MKIKFKAWIKITGQLIKVSQVRHFHIIEGMTAIAVKMRMRRSIGIIALLPISTGKLKYLTTFNEPR
jgi:hypothetical protein